MAPKIEMSPIHIPKTTKNRLKERAKEQGKKLYWMCDEILRRSLRKAKK